MRGNSIFLLIFPCQMPLDFAGLCRLYVFHRVEGPGAALTGDFGIE